MFPVNLHPKSIEKEQLWKVTWTEDGG